MAEKVDPTPVEDAKSAAKDYYDTEKAALDELKTELSAHVSGIVDKYSDPDTYKTIGTDILNSALTTIQTAYQTMLTKVTTLYNSVLTQLATVQAMFPGTGSGIIGQLSQVTSILDAIDLILTKIEAIETVITDIVATLNK